MSRTHSRMRNELREIQTMMRVGEGAHAKPLDSALSIMSEMVDHIERLERAHIEQLERAAEETAAAPSAPQRKFSPPADSSYEAVASSATFKPGGHHIDYDKRARGTGHVLLYSITVLSARHERRIPAICTSFEIAKGIVEQNQGDIYEGDGTLVVIEPFEGDVPFTTLFSQEQYWYAWRKNANTSGIHSRYGTDGYQPIHRPKEFGGIGNWGVG